MSLNKPKKDHWRHNYKLFVNQITQVVTVVLISMIVNKIWDFDRAILAAMIGVFLMTPSFMRYK